MQSLIQDFIYGLRWLRKHPAFTALTVLTLGVGIGVNTAMFSVINAVILRPLPYRNSDRLVWMNESGDEVSSRWLSYPNFVDWRERNQSFESMSLFRGWSVNMTGADAPEVLDVGMVSAGYFQVMGVAPLLGRDFTGTDDQPGANAVTVISYGFWQTRFGGDPNIVGKTITLDDQPCTVIGVMQQSFAHEGSPPLWLLAGQQNWNQRDVRNAGNVIARLKPGISIEQARSEMNWIARELLQEHPVANAGANQVRVVSLQESITGNVRWALQILFGAVSLVLLIACANVANLLLARTASRRKEFAVRAALGASRWRLIRQLLVESMILAVAGGIVGLIVTAWAMRLLSGVAYNAVPRLATLQLDYKVLAFNLLISVLTGLLFGVVPAFRFSKAEVHEGLKDSSSTATESKGKRLRGALVVAEVALSVALLTGAGLLVRSMVRLFNSDLSFDPHNVLTMELKVSRNRYKDKQELSRVLHEVLERVKRQPGVEAATLSANLPGLADGWQNDIWPEGQPQLKPGELINVDWSIVSADYFATMKIPIIRGRSFTKEEDEAGKPVMLVDETLARRFWPNEDAVGKHIKYDSPTWHEIIGVVKQVGFYGSEAKPLIKIYTPMGRAVQRNPVLAIRANNSDARALAAAVAREVHLIDKDLPLTEVTTLDDLLAREVVTRQFNAWLFAIFAVLALALAATGVYGVISYSVAQRTHEVGIRMALGAGRRDVLRLFVSQGMTLVFGGLVAGLAIALVLTRLLSTLLFGVSTTDKTTFAVVSVLLIAVGLLACYLPVRRATKVDPLVALRYE